MNYYEERKKAFFANENIDSSMASIKKNITLRKKDLREKIFLKRLNYSNSIQTTNIFELNPASLKLTDEEKNFIITEMSEENINYLLRLLHSENSEHIKLAVFTLRKYTAHFENQETLHLDIRILQVLIQILMNNENKNVMYEIYWIFINSTLNLREEFRQLINNKQFFKIISKHFKYGIEDLCEEILWFLCNVIDEAPLDLINNIIETKLLQIILDNLYREFIEYTILLKSLLFIKLFLQASSKITLSDFLYFKINEIVIAYIYHKSDCTLKLCLEILVILTEYGSNLITKQIIEGGIIPKLMKFEKFIKDLDIEPRDKNLSYYLKDFPKKILILILKIFGNILSDNEDNDFSHNFKEFGLLDFLSAYYHNESVDIRKLINWICSNFISFDKSTCMSLIKSPIFAMIIESFPKETKTKIIQETLYLINNILCFQDSEITFSFFTYDLMQNLIDLYYSNAENWNIIPHILMLNIFKSIFQIENLYKHKEAKNYNFDDNNLNFIDHFLRQGCLEFLHSLKAKFNEKIDESIDDIEIEIKKKFNNSN